LTEEESIAHGYAVYAATGWVRIETAGLSSDFRPMMERESTSHPFSET
jgi:hypothetical protein